MLWSVAAASLAAGLLIGLTGVGGVLLVPALTEFAALPVERAIAASMFGFLFAGVLAAFVHLRRTRLAPRGVVMLCASAAAGALLGAATLDWLPVRAVRSFIALLALASGLHALLVRNASGSRHGVPPTGVLGVLGLVVGYGSAISGTGGPVMLIPLLLALQTPVAAAVALGIAAQLPIVLTATIVNALAARIDFALGGMLGALLVAGTLAGTWLAPRVSGRGLTVAVALTLVGVGLWYGYAAPPAPAR